MVEFEASCNLLRILQQKRKKIYILVLLEIYNFSIFCLPVNKCAVKMCILHVWSRPTYAVSPNMTLNEFSFKQYDAMFLNHVTSSSWLLNSQILSSNVFWFLRC